MKNVRDAGFSRKRDGNAGSGPPLPDPVCAMRIWPPRGRHMAIFLISHWCPYPQPACILSHKALEPG